MGKGYLDVRLARQELLVSAGNWVGLIPLNDRIAISVEPKIGGSKFARLLALAEGEATPLDIDVRGFAAADDTRPSIIDALARGLLRNLREIERRGLHKDYVAHLARTSFPKGRIDYGRTTAVATSRGITSQVVARWHERTSDTAPNRLLRYAVRIMAHHYRGLPKRISRQFLPELNRADAMLGAVEIDYARSFQHSRLVQQPVSMPSSRAYYVPAIRLARALLRGAGVNLPQSDDLVIEPLVFNMEVVFEGYIQRVLRRELAAADPGIRVLDGRHGGGKWLFQEPPDRATPDVVVFGPGADDVASCIGEVKYIDRAVNRDERNQLIAYAMTYGSRVNFLIHPAFKDDAQVHRRHAYRTSSIGAAEFHFYGIDLDAPDLGDEERLLGAAMMRAMSRDFPVGR